MATVQLSDIYDPEKLTKVIGNLWFNDSKLVQSNAVQIVPTTSEGTLLTAINQKTFQDTQGQVLKANGEISFEVKQQEGVNSPKLWRYGGEMMAKVLKNIEVKDIPMIRTNQIEKTRLAAAQYADDSMIASLEGIGGALTANQTDVSGSGDMSYDAIRQALAKQLDRTNSIRGGAFLSRSKAYYDLIGEALLSRSTTTASDEIKTGIIRSGSQEDMVLGLSSVTTDKLALDGSGDQLSYLVGPGAIMMGSNEPMSIEITPNPKGFQAFFKFVNMFSVAVEYMNWSLAGKEDVNDVELATSGNWNLGTFASSNQVPIYRLQTT